MNDLLKRLDAAQIGARLFGHPEHGDAIAEASAELMRMNDRADASDRIIAWLTENAPVSVWRGSNADGSPAVSVASMDLDGLRTIEPLENAPIWGEGATLAAAIADADKRSREMARELPDDQPNTVSIDYPNP